MKLKGYKWKFESKEDFQKVANECNSVKQLMEKIGLKYSGGSHKEFKKKINDIGLNISHFKGKGWNKGIKKENDFRVKQISDNLKKQYKNGELVSSWLGRHHTEETKKKLSILRKKRGNIHGAGRGKTGWYKGYWCDSSWELAWVIYNLEHGINFKRNKEGFKYNYLGKEYRFYPDFIMDDGSYVEIKGWLDDKNKEKIKSFKGQLKVIMKNEIVPYIEYVEQKYGKQYIQLYEK